MSWIASTASSADFEVDAEYHCQVSTTSHANSDGGFDRKRPESKPANETGIGPALVAAFDLVDGDPALLLLEETLISLDPGPTAGHRRRRARPIARPLLFASLQPDFAEARGVPMKSVSSFMVLVAVSTAETIQIVGILLTFALLVAPAASASRLIKTVATGVATSIGLAVGMA